MNLTPATVRTWNAIADYITTHGYSPTLDELAISIGVKRAKYILGYLERLESAGIIIRLRSKRGSALWRGIRLLVQPPSEALL